MKVKKHAIPIAYESVLVRKECDLVGKEDMRRTNWSENQLVKANPVDGSHCCIILRHRECLREERKPLELQGAHDETVGHQSNQSFKVERWRSRGKAVRDHEFRCEWGFFVIRRHFYTVRDVFADLLMTSSFGPRSCECLCNCVRYSTKNLKFSSATRSSNSLWYAVH